jgi:hypothetical protein
MLAITGKLADGTITWMCGPKTLEDHIGPNAARRRDANAAAPSPGSSPASDRGHRATPTRRAETIGEQLVIYGQLPPTARCSTRGRRRPADIALVGDETALGRELDRLRDVGVTDFVAAVVPIDRDAEQRTLDFLATRVSKTAAGARV